MTEVELTKGERLRLRRDRLNLSRKRLSKLAGVSVGAIFRAEHDQNIEEFTKEAIVGALDAEERKRQIELAVARQESHAIESPSTPVQYDRRSAELSAASAPVLSPSVTPPAQDQVLDERDIAMLPDHAQRLVRRYLSGSPEDQARIQRIIDAVFGDDSATGTSGGDALPRRFRAR